MNFHPALSGVGKIIDQLWYMFQASDDMRETFRDKPMMAFRRPRNLRDELVKSRLKRHREENRDRRKCGKTHCQICKLINEGDKFYDKGRTYHINYSFDCDSRGVVYLIKCKKCLKLYVGSTIKTFPTRFNNHKSSMKRYERGQMRIPGEHLYAHFFDEGHVGLADVEVMIIDRTNVNDPTQREGFWAYKLDSFVPKGLNIRDFM